MESKKTERDCVHFIGTLGTRPTIARFIAEGFYVIASQNPKTPLCQKQLPAFEDDLSKEHPVDVTCYGPNDSRCPGAVFRQINPS